jgi:predicted anti-sigma-YlaC factor YlaD
VPEHRKAAEITCRALAKQATEFLENRLPAAVNLDIWRHLEGCPGCRTYVEQLALVRDTLRKQPQAQIPDNVRQKLLKRLGRMARGSGASK